MGWFWLIVGIAVAVVIGLILSRGGVYRRVFAHEHLLEVARAVVGLKAAVLSKIIVGQENEVVSRDDPRVLMTSERLVVFYTIERFAGDRYVHHYSISLAGSYTAHAVGESYVLFVAKLLGIPAESLGLAVGKSTVHHAEFELSAAEQSQFASRPVRRMTSADVAAFLDEWRSQTGRLPWHQN